MGLAMLPVAGGLALVMHILAGASLAAAYLVLVLLGGAGWVAFLRVAGPEQRRALATRVRAGLLAGLVATLAYDAARYGVVAVLSWSLRPFEAWRLFGEALLGPGASPSAAVALGTVYHLVNGVGFAVAFLLLVRPTLPRGVVWGLGLELAMALLYPSWLRVSQLQEFLTVSVLGHVVYGGTLALVARRLLDRAASARVTVQVAAGRGAR